eukprot:jgi/Bigna1/85299/estExt_fgenesh1_pg.C_30181
MKSCTSGMSQRRDQCDLGLFRSPNPRLSGNKEVPATWGRRGRNMQPTPPLVLTSDDTGLYKVVDVAKKKVDRRFGRQAQGRGIEAMAWSGLYSGGDSYDSHFLSALQNGRVENRSRSTGEVTQSFQMASAGCSGLATIDSKRLLSGTKNGVVQIFEEGKEASTFKVGEKTCRVKFCPGSSAIATGGNEELLKVWDLATKKQTFKARNVKPDKLDLRYPVHILDISFFTNTSSSSSSQQQQQQQQAATQIVTATAHHQVRFYDTKAQKRAIWSHKIGENAVRSVLALRDGITIIAGDGAGETLQLDSRVNGRIVGKFKGVGGAITCISQDESGEFLSTTSLDRFVRVYDIKTRKMLNKVYLKQRVSSCLFCKNPEGTEEQAPEGKDKTVWDILESQRNKTVSSKKRKQKRAGGEK